MATFIINEQPLGLQNKCECSKSKYKMAKVLVVQTAEDGLVRTDTEKPIHDEQVVAENGVNASDWRYY